MLTFKEGASILGKRYNLSAAEANRDYKMLILEDAKLLGVTWAQKDEESLNRYLDELEKEGEKEEANI